MHKRFDAIREHLRTTYSVPGDTLDAIMNDVLDMAQDLPRRKLIATIRHEDNKAFFEVSEDFDPEEFKDGDDIVLKNEAVIGSVHVQRGKDGIIDTVSLETTSELIEFPKDTPVFVLH